MMDTVLNLGLNENTIRGLIEKTRNERFVGITEAPVLKVRIAITGVVHAFLPKKSTKMPSSRLVFWSISIATSSFLFKHFNISFIAFFFNITQPLKTVRILYKNSFNNRLSKGLTTELNFHFFPIASAPISQLPR